MRNVELTPGVHSSILGFGCAPVLGAIGGRVAERALNCALDHGVTHFDLARSYGYGEAEKFVGRFLKHKRDQVTIASKFGIQATWKAQVLRPLKPVVRMVKDRIPRRACSPEPEITQASSCPERKDHFHRKIPLTSAAMVRSLDRSLDALGTDYLDLLFIHEPTGEIAFMDELAATAVELKKKGKIRGWGLAFDWRSHKALSSIFDQVDILQFNSQLGTEHYQSVKDQRSHAANVIFSPFRNSRNPDTALRNLFTDFQKSVVLCSMFNPMHIEQNATIANEASSSFSGNCH